MPSQHTARPPRNRNLVRLGLALLTGPLASLGMGSLTPVNAAEAAHVQARLVADEQWIQPGHLFWLGVHFEVEKGWHIYWTNPGDSGQATRVQWTLPAGFAAARIRWPYPQRIQDSATVVDYGYENQVTLLVPIRPPARLSTERSAELSAVAKWLVCSDICIAGQANLNLQLPVRKAAPARDPGSRALFDEARARLPKPMPPAWRVRAASQSDHFVLELETGRTEVHAAFFPLDAEVIENAAPQEEVPFARGIRLRLKKSSQLAKSVTMLRGVIVLSPGRAFSVAARVAPSGRLPSQ
jgi:DsbC/DsbD-like thiol-disulfide interchange protein